MQMKLCIPSPNQIAAHNTSHIEILTLLPFCSTYLDNPYIPQHTHSLCQSLAHFQSLSFSLGPGKFLIITGWAEYGTEADHTFYFCLLPMLGPLGRQDHAPAYQWWVLFEPSEKNGSQTNSSINAEQRKAELWMQEAGAKQPQEQWDLIGATPRGPPIAQKSVPQTRHVHEIPPLRVVPDCVFQRQLYPYIFISHVLFIIWC